MNPLRIMSRIGSSMFDRQIVNGLNSTFAENVVRITSVVFAIVARVAATFLLRPVNSGSTNLRPGLRKNLLKLVLLMTVV